MSVQPARPLHERQQPLLSVLLPTMRVKGRLASFSVPAVLGGVGPLPCRDLTDLDEFRIGEGGDDRSGLGVVDGQAALLCHGREDRVGRGGERNLSTTLRQRRLGFTEQAVAS